MSLRVWDVGTISQMTGNVTGEWDLAGGFTVSSDCWVRDRKYDAQ